MSEATATPAYTPEFAKAGTVLIAGSVAYSMTGRKEPPVAFDGIMEHNLWNFHCLETLRDVQIARVFSGPTSVSYMAIDTKGGLYVWGRNERGQLGVGHQNNVYTPTLIPHLPPVTHCALGRGHSLIICNGDIYAAGDNKIAQCGAGRMTDTPFLKFTKLITGVPSGKAVQVAAGADFSLALDSDGVVYSCGSQQYGQCGTNTTGEWIVSAGKTAFEEIPYFQPIPDFNVKCKQIAAGANHSLALTTEGQVYSWGMGGYGRLGHGNAQDELVPKLIKEFEPEHKRVGALIAGNSASFAISVNRDALYFFGITKKSGECTTRPRIMDDFSGTHIAAFSSGATSTVVAIEGYTVAFGPSPTYGELGFGPTTRSSTKPKYVDDLTGLQVIDVAVSLGGTILIVDTTSGNEGAIKAKELLASGQIPSYTPVEPEPGLGTKRRAEFMAQKQENNAKKSQVKKGRAGDDY